MSKARMESILSKYFGLTERNDTICECRKFQINAYTNGIYPSNDTIPVQQRVI